jgi:hypothetical protein
VDLDAPPAFAVSWCVLVPIVIARGGEANGASFRPRHSLSYSWRGSQKSFGVITVRRER